MNQLERIGSIEQGIAKFDSWNKDYNNRPYLGIEEKTKLSDWLKEKLK